MDGLTHVQPLNSPDARALEILTIERSLPWIRFSPESHSSFAKFLADWRPSATSQADVAWICIDNKRTDTTVSAKRPGFHKAWDDICTDHQPSTADLDEIARRFNVRTGKWLLFAKSADVDALWHRIANGTHAGTLGISAKVSPRNDAESHVICVYTRDYLDRADAEKVRQGLRRLGVKDKIGYKPDIYTTCRVYKKNAWGIPPSRYFS